MGRTFKSVRMGSQEVAARWLGASRALSKEDQIYGQRLAEMVKMHFSEAFYALDGFWTRLPEECKWNMFLTRAGG